MNYQELELWVTRGFRWSHSLLSLQRPVGGIYRAFPTCAHASGSTDRCHFTAGLPQIEDHPRLVWYSSGFPLHKDIYPCFLPVCWSLSGKGTWFRRVEEAVTERPRSFIRTFHKHLKYMQAEQTELGLRLQFYLAQDCILITINIHTL